MRMRMSLCADCPAARSMWMGARSMGPPCRRILQVWHVGDVLGRAKGVSGARHGACVTRSIAHACTICVYTRAFNVYVSAGVHASTYTHTQTRTCSHTRQVRRAGTARKARSRPAERFVWPPLRPGHGLPRARHWEAEPGTWPSRRGAAARGPTWLANQLGSRANLPLEPRCNADRDALKQL